MRQSLPGIIASRDASACGFLCGHGFEDRKQWIEDRLKELVGVFAVELAGFAVMDNHLHLLVRLDLVVWPPMFPQRKCPAKTCNCNI